MRALMRSHVLAIQAGINWPGKPLIIFKQPRNLSPEIFLGGKPSIISRLPESVIRTPISQRIGDSIGRFPRGQLLPSILIWMAVAKFHAIQEFRFQKHGRQHLLQPCDIASNFDGRAKK